MLKRLLRQYRYVWVVVGFLSFLLWQPLYLASAQSVPPTPSVVLQASSDQTYEQLIDAARQSAIAEVGARFQGNPELDRLSFDVMGKRRGSQVPILRVDVGRSQWQQALTQPEAWSKVYSESEVLLGFATTAAPAAGSSSSTDSVPNKPTSSEAAASSSPPAAPATETGADELTPGEVLSPAEILARRIANPPKPTLVPAPRGLESARYDESAGDFFDEIVPDLPGNSYARWVEYPVPVYIQSDNAEWANSVQAAVDEWSKYVPLSVVSEEKEASISIYRVQPLREGANNRQYSGAADQEFFTGPDGKLQHRVTIVLSAYQSLGEVATVARHELGHALGLWGHTSNQRDLMFGGNHAAATGYQRVMRIAQISPHDINTLKRVYEQPTLIGQ
jgi:predicted Zn-dependent protease